MKRGLERLNSLTREELSSELLKCCGSTAWARGVADERPFSDARQLLDVSDRVWQSLGEEDWLEAFSHHPKIGERKAAREVAAEARRWSEQEQSGTRASSERMTAELARLNRAYEEKFGYIFIVCATGKTGEEMLAILRGRLGNDAETEIKTAAEEQRRITNLRLQKLLEQ